MTAPAEDPHEPAGIFRRIDERLRALERQMTVLETHQQHADMDVARASDALDHRLEGLNRAREQLERERGLYVTLTLYSSEMASHAAMDHAFHDEVERRLRHLETSIANWTGMMEGTPKFREDQDVRMREIEGAQRMYAGWFRAVGTMSAVIAFLALVVAIISLYWGGKHGP